MHGERRIIQDRFTKGKGAEGLHRFKGGKAGPVDNVHTRRIGKHRHVYHLEMRSYWLRLILDVVY